MVARMTPTKTIGLDMVLTCRLAVVLRSSVLLRVTLSEQNLQRRRLRPPTRRLSSAGISRI